jgi:uncharacterized membrane protein YgcG
MREKIIYALGLILAAQLLWTGASIAESNLKLRVSMFARAAVSEALKTHKSYSVSNDQTIGMRLNDIEKRIADSEGKVAVFLELQHNKKREVISQFRSMLIDKCCRLAQGKLGIGAALTDLQPKQSGGRGGGGDGNGNGNGGGHRRGGGGGFGNTGFPKRGGR